jgi:hypothetical protein
MYYDYNLNPDSFIYIVILCSLSNFVHILKKVHIIGEPILHMCIQKSTYYFVRKNEENTHSEIECNGKMRRLFGIKKMVSKSEN